MDSEIIKALKENNWMNYGGWPLAKREVAHKIGIANFVKRCRPDIWEEASGEFDDFGIYSLKDDFPEKPEIIVEKAIYPNEAELCIDDGGEPTSIHILLSSTRFIGFKYEDGGVRTDSIMYMPNENYKGVNHKCEIEGLRLGEVKVIRATHALFQVTK